MTRRERKQKVEPLERQRGSLLSTSAPFMVAVATFIAFLPALQGQFVSWDDRANFLTNTHYRGLGASELHWMWTTRLLGHYVPLSWMSLGLDYLLWGMSPAGYHFTSMVLHSINAALVFVIARKLFSWNDPPSAHSERITIAAMVSALFFSVHPLRVESVAWITERRDVLSLSFLLLSVMLSLRSAAEVRIGRTYAFALVAFVCALLSKATTVTLPVVLLILNAYPLRRIGGAVGWWSDRARRVYLELLPFFLLAMVTGVGSIIALTPGKQLGLAQKIAVSFYGIVFYLKKTIVPHGLAPLYELPWRVDVFATRFVVDYLLVALLIIITWRIRHRWPGAVAALIAFIAMTLPLLGIVQNGPQIAADRYTYHSGVALSFIAGGALLAWPQRSSLLRSFAVAGLLLFAGLTWQQTGVWRNSSAVWDRVLSVDGGSAIGRNGRGTELAEQGNSLDAMEEYRQSIRLNAHYVEPLNNLGYELAKLGRNADAIEQYRAALAIKPDYADAEINWGNVLHGQRQYDEAIAHFAKAAAIEPGHAGAQFNWGITLAERGDFAEAVVHLRRAATLDPSDADTRAALADVTRVMMNGPAAR